MMKRVLIILILITFLLPTLTGFLYATPIKQNVSYFSDLSDYKVKDLIDSKDGMLIGYIKLPKRAIITNATISVNSVTKPNYRYPNDIFMDIGDDGKFEWAYSGNGYGALGQQRKFSNNKTYSALEITGDDYNNTIGIRMPKNATIFASTMYVDGRGNISGTDPNTDWKSILSQSSHKVVANITEGKIYFNRQNQKYFDIYDPWTNIWSTSSSCSINIPFGHSITRAGDDIFICASQWSGSAWVYKMFSYNIINNTWTDRGNVPSGATNIVSGSLTYDENSYIYAIERNFGTPQFYRYSINNNTWFKLKSPPVGGWYPTICYLNNKVYYMNYTWNGFGRQIHFYSPVNDTWFRLKDAPNGVISDICTDGYNIFGSNTQGKILKYDVLSDTWTTTGKTISGSVGGIAGLAYSDKTFYLCRYTTSSGYYSNPGVGSGNYPLIPTLNVGDNGGTPEWEAPGDLRSESRVNDFGFEIGNILSNTPPTYVDDYGNEFVDIPINVTSNTSCEFTMKRLVINYTYTHKVNLNPFTGNITNAFNDLVPDVGEGDIVLPVIVYSSSVGHINISDISIDFFVPDLTNDRFELVGGVGAIDSIIYADYMNYTFLVNVTNKAGYSDVKDVTLHLDVYGEDIQIQWNETFDTFNELRDPKNLVILDTLNCNSTHNGIDRWSLNFTMRFSWDYMNDSMELCAINTTNDTGAFRYNEVQDVYRVENDLEFDGVLIVEAQNQGFLSSPGWVRGAEQITWSNMRVVYAGTTNVYPEDEHYNVTIYDDDNGKWEGDPATGQQISIQTVSDSQSDYWDKHYINITDISGNGQDVSNVWFIIRIDETGPEPPEGIKCHADSFTHGQITYDDDTEIFVTWDPASDGDGVGVLEYAMEYNNPNPIDTKSNGDPGFGVEGNCTFYVRALDKVGNWGQVGSANIFIDLTNLSYTNPTPTNEIWLTNHTVNCGITINDINGSGVQVSTIEYRYSNDGQLDTEGWIDFNDSAYQNNETVSIQQIISFNSDGDDKLVQWRAKDMIRNHWILLEPPQNLKIDTTPATINYLEPDLDLWLNTISPTINFTINDTLGSGVDTSKLEYSITTTGLDGFGDWIEVTSEINGQSGGVNCSITPTFISGNANFLRVRATDIAGNIITFNPKKVLIDLSEPQFLNQIPNENSWSGDKVVKCKISIFDPASSVDVQTIKYSYSTNGTEDYFSWRKIPKADIVPDPDGFTFNTSITIKFSDGTNNYIRWSAFDLAGNFKISPDFRIQVDVSPIIFEDAKPIEDQWFGITQVPCSIIYNDSLGSGILPDTIEYAISTQGLDGFTSWTTDGLEIEEQDKFNIDGQTSYGFVFASVAPEFSKGTENYIRWRGKDMVGTMAYSKPIQISVDLDEVVYSNEEPQEDTIYKSLELTCKIEIDDVGGSGINPTSVEYSYSTSGLSSFSAWSNDSLIWNNSIFQVDLDFKSGKNNYLKWRASDIAGNGPAESRAYNIIVNLPPIPIIDKPTDDSKFSINEDIHFSAESTYDPEPDDELRYEWSSNISNIFGRTEDFSIRLPPGVHLITLKVSDSTGQSATTSIIITVSQIYLDTDGDNTPDHKDDDDDNDGVPDNKDAFPIFSNESVDTDGDGIGNNADPDDDGDEYPDTEDAYPLDDTKWKEEKTEEKSLFSEQYFLFLLLVIVIIIIAIIGLAVRRSRKKKKEEAEAAAAEEASRATAEQGLAAGTAAMQSQAPSQLEGATQLGTAGLPLLPGTVHEPATISTTSQTQTQTPHQQQALVRVTDRQSGEQTIQSYIPPPSLTTTTPGVDSTPSQYVSTTPTVQPTTQPSVSTQIPSPTTQPSSTTQTTTTDTTTAATQTTTTESPTTQTSTITPSTSESQNTEEIKEQKLTSDSSDTQPTLKIGLTPDEQQAIKKGNGNGENKDNEEI